jgi:hypothetical protein
MAAEHKHLDWFRERLAASRVIEPKDPAPVLAWPGTKNNAVRSNSSLN